jgi:hypothetical protein
MTEALTLIVKNIKRAATLINSFKKLSAHQMVDTRAVVDLYEASDRQPQTLPQKTLCGWSKTYPLLSPRPRPAAVTKELCLLYWLCW